MVRLVVRCRRSRTRRETGSRPGPAEPLEAPFPSAAGVLTLRRAVAGEPGGNPGLSRSGEWERTPARESEDLPLRPCVTRGLCTVTSRTGSAVAAVVGHAPGRASLPDRVFRAQGRRKARARCRVRRLSRHARRAVARGLRAGPDRDVAGRSVPGGPPLPGALHAGAGAAASAGGEVPDGGPALPGAPRPVPAARARSGPRLRLPVGVGMASSTADIVATLRCRGDVPLPCDTDVVLGILAAMERSDSVFLDEFALHLSGRHRVVRRLGTGHRLPHRLCDRAGHGGHRRRDLAAPGALPAPRGGVRAVPDRPAEGLRLRRRRRRGAGGDHQRRAVPGGAAQSDVRPGAGPPGAVRCRRCLRRAHGLSDRLSLRPPPGLPRQIRTVRVLPLARPPVLFRPRSYG
ncbi:hypothetical protein SPURM210S_05054 [Streptomyces purpurascens]